MGRSSPFVMGRRATTTTTPTTGAALLLALLALATSAPFSSAAAAGTPRKCPKCIKTVVVLGDSVADKGLPFGLWALDNQTIPFTALGYNGGRYTNGRVWPEHLSSSFNLTLVDFAIGGSAVNIVPGRPPLSLQINNLKAYMKAYGASLPKPILGVISIGANDVLDLGGQPLIANNVTAALEYFANVVKGTMEAAQTLLGLGASQVMVVPTFVAIKVAPLFRLLLSQGPEGQARAGQIQFITDLLGEQMNSSVAQFNMGAGRVAARYLDASKALVQVQADPHSYYLRQALKQCLVTDPLSAEGVLRDDQGQIRLNPDGTPMLAKVVFKCENPQYWLWWDWLHPTDTGHQILAKYIASELRAARWL